MGRRQRGKEQETDKLGGISVCYSANSCPSSQDSRLLNSPHSILHEISDPISIDKVETVATKEVKKEEPVWLAQDKWEIPKYQFITLIELLSRNQQKCDPEKNWKSCVAVGLCQVVCISSCIDGLDFFIDDKATEKSIYATEWPVCHGILFNWWCSLIKDSRDL